MWSREVGWNAARVGDCNSGKEVARMTHDSGVNSVAFSPDGKYVVSGGDDTYRPRLGSLTGTEIAHMTHDEIVYFCRLQPRWKICGLRKL